jgi:hypothetical protein
VVALRLPVAGCRLPKISKTGEALEEKTPGGRPPEGERGVIGRVLASLMHATASTEQETSCSLSLADLPSRSVAVGRARSLDHLCTRTKESIFGRIEILQTTRISTAIVCSVLSVCPCRRRARRIDQLDHHEVWTRTLMPHPRAAYDS